MSFFIPYATHCKCCLALNEVDIIRTESCVLTASKSAAELAQQLGLGSSSAAHGAPRSLYLAQACGGGAGPAAPSANVNRTPNDLHLD